MDLVSLRPVPDQQGLHNEVMSFFFLKKKAFLIQNLMAAKGNGDIVLGLGACLADVCVSPGSTPTL